MFNVSGMTPLTNQIASGLIPVERVANSSAANPSSGFVIESNAEQLVSTEGQTEKSFGDLVSFMSQDLPILTAETIEKSIRPNASVSEVHRPLNEGSVSFDSILAQTNSVASRLSPQAAVSHGQPFVAGLPLANPELNPVNHTLTVASPTNLVSGSKTETVQHTSLTGGATSQSSEVLNPESKLSNAPSTELSKSPNLGHAPSHDTRAPAPTRLEVGEGPSRGSTDLRTSLPPAKETIGNGIEYLAPINKLPLEGSAINRRGQSESGSLEPPAIRLEANQTNLGLTASQVNSPRSANLSDALEPRAPEFPNQPLGGTIQNPEFKLARPTIQTSPQPTTPVLSLENIRSAVNEPVNVEALDSQQASTDRRPAESALPARPDRSAGLTDAGLAAVNRVSHSTIPFGKTKQAEQKIYDRTGSQGSIEPGRGKVSGTSLPTDLAQPQTSQNTIAVPGTINSTGKKSESRSKEETSLAVGNVDGTESAKHDSVTKPGTIESLGQESTAEPIRLNRPSSFQALAGVTSQAATSSIVSNVPSGKRVQSPASEDSLNAGSHQSAETNELGPVESKDLRSPMGSLENKFEFNSETAVYHQNANTSANSDSSTNGIDPKQSPELPQFEMASDATDNPPPTTSDLNPVPVNSGAGEFESALRPGKISAQLEEPASFKDAETFIERAVLERIQDARGKAKTEIKIEMDPPELGPILIRLVHSDGQSTASITVANEAAQQQLQQNLQSLQSSLENLGVELDDVQFGFRNESGKGDQQDDWSERGEFHEANTTGTHQGSANQPVPRIGKIQVIDFLA